jgi:hypothetical protein
MLFTRRVMIKRKKMKDEEKYFDPDYYRAVSLDYGRLYERSDYPEEDLQQEHYLLRGLDED